MQNVWVPKAHFLNGQAIGDIIEATNKLFGVSMEEKEECFVLSDEDIAIILKKMPQIRKWQICAEILEEKLFSDKGITLSKELIRERILNSKDFLKRNGISEKEATDLLEELAQRFMGRIFKKGKKEEE